MEVDFFTISQKVSYPFHFCSFIISQFCFIATTGAIMVEFSLIFVAPALAGRHRRAIFRPFVRSYVRPSIRQHLTWVSCERNSSYSFAPIVLKLCMCFPHGMRMCMWIGHNYWINFCHFFDIVNLVIFHPDYIDRGYLL